VENKEKMASLNQNTLGRGAAPIQADKVDQTTDFVFAVRPKWSQANTFIVQNKLETSR
jgi:hypothetical protein